MVCNITIIFLKKIKMTKMKKIIIYISALIILNSCRKDKIKEINCEITTSNLIGFNKITDVKFSAGNTNVGSVINNPTYFAQCRKDDQMALGLNGFYSVSEGAVVCNPRNNNSSGTWSLTNGNTLNITGNFENEKFIIENFTCITMDLKITLPLPNTNTTYTYTYSLERL